MSEPTKSDPPLKIHSVKVTIGDREYETDSAGVIAMPPTDPPDSTWPPRDPPRRQDEIRLQTRDILGGEEGYFRHSNGRSYQVRLKRNHRIPYSMFVSLRSVTPDGAATAWIETSYERSDDQDIDWMRRQEAIRHLIEMDERQNPYDGTIDVTESEAFHRLFGNLSDESSQDDLADAVAYAARSAVQNAGEHYDFIVDAGETETDLTIEPPPTPSEMRRLLGIDILGESPAIQTIKRELDRVWQRHGMKNVSLSKAINVTVQSWDEEHIIAMLMERFDCVDRHKQLEELQAFAHRLHVHVDDQMTFDGFTNDEELDEDQPRLCPVCGKERDHE